MAITKIDIENFTVFANETIEFNNGINVLIGENGTGKTHIMKLLYSACQSTSSSVSFSNKIVRCFLPDDYRIGRLRNRDYKNKTTNVKIYGYGDGSKNTKTMSISFSNYTRKWEADVEGEDSWENEFNSLNSVFIPAKEILSNAYNLSAAVERGNVIFDDTYIDIINSAKIDISSDTEQISKEKQLKKIEKIIDGKVIYNIKNDEFYLKKGRDLLEFNLVAEGVRKIALLWQLIKNGTLKKGSILFWDEPEANINPIHIPLIVEILIELQENGVQIFISTHDYILAKYFDVKVQDSKKILFHSLFEDKYKVRCESCSKFKDLEQNTIRDTFIQLYKDEVERALEE